jgi:GNAT superfamily N-acetyltransferase
MSPDDFDIDYSAELPTAGEFERLFRSSGWTEAMEITAERLAESLTHVWYSVCARRGGEIAGTGMILGDGVLHALIVDVIVLPDLRGHGIGTEIMNRLIAHCDDERILQVQLFSARGKRSFYERLGFVARPDDGPGMELGGLG